MVGFLFLSSVQFASLRSLNSENKISYGVDDYNNDTFIAIINMNQTCESDNDCGLNYFCCDKMCCNNTEFIIFVATSQYNYFQYFII